MATRASYYGSLSVRRAAIYNYLKTQFYNAPHPLDEVSFSGSLTFTADQRDYSSPPATAYVSVLTANLTLAPVHTRITETNTPFSLLGGVGNPSGALADGEFLLYHAPERPWDYMTLYGDLPATEIVGTIDVDTYTWNGSSYDFDSSASYDANCESSVTIDGGGHPTTGGKDVGADTEKTEIGLSLTFGAETSGSGIILPSAVTVDILRLPWDFAWATETTAFSDWFTDYVAGRNTFYGGGYSATCSIGAVFS